MRVSAALEGELPAACAAILGMAQLAELQRFLATAEGLAPDLNPINLTSNTTLALALTVALTVALTLALTLTRRFARPARADRAAAWHGPFPIRALHYPLFPMVSARGRLW